MVKRDVKSIAVRGDGQYRHHVSGTAGERRAGSGGGYSPGWKPSCFAPLTASRSVRPRCGRSVGHLGDLLVVGDHHHGLGKLLTGHLHQAQHILAGSAVQVSGGFVGQKNGWLGRQSPGDGHALLLAAGELARQVPELFLQAQGGDDLLHIGLIHFLPSSSTGRTMFSTR